MAVRTSYQINMGIFKKLLEELKSDLYYLSKDNIKNLELKPSVPTDFFTRNNLVDSKTPRVVFAKNISALIALVPEVKEGMQLIVYSPAEDYIGFEPNNEQSALHSLLDGETWITNVVKVVEVGRIEVGKESSEKRFVVGEDIFSYPLYEWRWV